MTGRFLRDAICVCSIVPKGRIVLVEILRSNICKTGVYRGESLSRRYQLAPAATNISQL